MAQVTGRKVAIIATDYFEEVELFQPREELEAAGATVEVLAPHAGKIKGLKHVEPGRSVAVDKTLTQATPETYDAVVVPGGVVNADHLRVDETAQAFVRAMLGSAKPTAVICHGPWLLVSAGLLEGRKLTSYFTLKDDIINAGGNWVDEPLVQDGSLITSRKPADLPDFIAALIDALAK